jgi:hypothetical protein
MRLFAALTKKSDTQRDEAPRLFKDAPVLTDCVKTLAV